jgi:hypothetical protein
MDLHEILWKKMFCAKKVTKLPDLTVLRKEQPLGSGAPQERSSMPEDTSEVVAVIDLYLQALASSPEKEDAEKNSEDLHAFVYEKVGKQYKNPTFFRTFFVAG